MALLETPQNGGALVSEAKGFRSREKATITGSNCAANKVLGKVTASGKYVAVAPAAGDGSQTAVAVLIEAVDASGGDKVSSIWARDCELNEYDLDFGALTTPQITTAKAQLAAVGIIVRPAV